MSIREQIANASPQEQAEAAEWLEADAAYLRGSAANYESHGQEWLAERVKANAEHSAAWSAEIRRRLEP